MNTEELDVKGFWERLKQLSKSHNVMQKTFCEELGLDSQQFSNKKNLGYFPTLEQLISLSNYFGVSVNYLVTGNPTDDTEKTLLDKIKSYEKAFEQIKQIVSDSTSD